MRQVVEDVFDALPIDRIAGAVERASPDVLRRYYVAKFVVAIVIVTLLMATVGGTNYLQAQQTIESSTEDRLGATASMHAGSFENWADTKRAQAATISSFDEVVLGSPEEAQARLYSALLQMTGDLVDAHLVETDSGEILASTSSSHQDGNLSVTDDPWASGGRLGDIARSNGSARFVGSTYSSEGASSKRVLSVASPIPNTDVKVIVLVVSLDGWLDTVSQPTEAHSTALVDTDVGAVAAGTGPVPDSLEPGSFVDAPASGIEVRQQGDHVYASKTLDVSGLVLVTSQPTSEAFALRDAVGLNVLLVVLTGMLSLGLVGLILGQQTVPPLVALREKAERMEDGDLEVDLETNRTDEIGRLYGAFDAMRLGLKEQIDLAEQARQEAEEAHALTEEVNQHIVEKATEYSTVMRQCADGDLTRRMDPESRNDAMQEIGREFNDMMDEIERTTASVTDFAVEVATASEEVTASSEEVRSSSVEVTESIQSISEGADRQHEQLQSVQEEAKELSATTEEIASLSNEVAELAERTASTGRDGRDAAEDAIEGMDEIRDESIEAVEAIEDLNEEIAAIDELVDIISDVAEQTNILALNANIEAARAGEAGSGFAVVADEVKDLAEHTREAAADIEDRIEDVQQRTDSTAGEVRRTRERIADNSAAVEHAIESLESIAEMAGETNTGVQDISAATQQQAATTERVVAMVEDAAEISRRTNEDAENVAAAAEEQTSALNEVSNSMDDLSGRSLQLEELLARFETDAESSGGETVGDIDDVETVGETRDESEDLDPATAPDPPD